MHIGGESFPPSEFWSRCQVPDNKTQMFSLYGTTELSCWAMLGQGNDNLGSTLSETLISLCCDSNNGTGELLIGKLHLLINRFTYKVLANKNKIFLYEFLSRTSEYGPERGWSRNVRMVCKCLSLTWLYIY